MYHQINLKVCGLSHIYSFVYTFSLLLAPPLYFHLHTNKKTYQIIYACISDGVVRHYLKLSPLFFGFIGENMSKTFVIDLLRLSSCFCFTYVSVCCFTKEVKKKDKTHVRMLLRQKKIQIQKIIMNK